jgi:TIR domain/SIR2-like domain
MNDSAWNRLFQKIQENNVVPIIGWRLLVAADGKTSLQSQVAKRLLEDCGKDPDVPLPAFRELSEAVGMLRASVDAQDLYDMVNDAIRKAMPVESKEIPKPIQQLAEISGFRLFVTLTPDDLLARTLRKRRAVNEIVHSPNLPTSEGKDLPKDWKETPGTVQLLYLFGKSRSAPMFAIHDEDVLEYAHNVISHGSQVPIGFLAELQQRNLLLVGCNFPDWVTRFFLRATNLRRLSEKDRRAWLIEPMPPEESLTVFLRSYSKETEILSQDPPVDFVAEMHRRWLEAYGGGRPPVEPEQAPQPPSAMFFISYSRTTDIANAELIYQALLNVGLTEADVWFDRRTVDPGEDYQRKIMDGIEGCRYFLPLVSKQSNRREEGYVFREWDKASERLLQMNREFLVPVIVDTDYQPEVYQAQQVWQWRQRHIDFGFAPRGVPDQRLADKFKLLVREARRVGEQS